MSNNIGKKNTIERPPIIAVMGHIDHGKSALLDYIRKSSIVESEAGGITQHISAYEVAHKTEGGKNKKITFLDTPGHEAFTAMRLRGANIADIAILIVSAEEGPKQQTIEALESIKKAKIPFVVAINKIDKPEANIEKVKQNLLEKEVYLEGYGGEIPWVAISAKTGQGIPDLLDTVLLVAEMEELKGNPDEPAEGFVLESNLDPQKGICATLIITNGTLNVGTHIVTENKIATIKLIHNFLGNSITKASFSSPVQITGFKKTPSVGSPFKEYYSKKEAEKIASEYTVSHEPKKEPRNDFETENKKIIIPMIIKADVLGTIEAVQYEITKIENEKVTLKIIHKGVGKISENDVQFAGNNTNTLIVGFNTKIDKKAKILAEKMNIKIETFNIIYKLTEWLEKEIKEKIPKSKVEKITGKAKILKIFSRTKDKQVIGGEVLEGVLKVGGKVRIIRRDFELERGIILELQSQKIKTGEVKASEQFGCTVKAKKDIAPGDILETFITIEE